MYHPTYAWMFFNWYRNGWWLGNTSCILESSVVPENIEEVMRTSLIFDHSPRIEDEQKDKPNQGNIVSTAYTNAANIMDLLSICLLYVGIIYCDYNKIYKGK